LIGRRRHPVFFRRLMTSAPFEPERAGKIVDATLATSTSPDREDRSRCRAIGWRGPRPQARAETPVDPDESVANEMLAVGITERVHGLRLTASHNVLAGFVGLDSGDCQQAELATLIVADNLC